MRETLRRTLGDPGWTPKHWWGRALFAAAYIAIGFAFAYVVRDEPYPLLWFAMGLLVTAGLYGLWWRWAMRTPTRTGESRAPVLGDDDTSGGF